MLDAWEWTKMYLTHFQSCHTPSLWILLDKVSYFITSKLKVILQNDPSKSPEMGLRSRYVTVCCDEIHPKYVYIYTYYIIYIYIATSIVTYYIYLEPKWPLFLKVNPPKQGLFQSKQGSFGFQVYRDLFHNIINMYTYTYTDTFYFQLPITIDCPSPTPIRPFSLG